MPIFWPIISFILLIASFGLAIYLAIKMLELETKDFLYATIGGLGFIVTWLMVSLLLDSQPAFILAIAGGFAWVLVSLVLRAYLKRTKKDI